MFDKIRADFRAVFEMDPAATNKLEVIFTYSGFHAILMYRFSNWFYRMGMPFFARCVSQFARFLTGIEIHPAAKIAGSFFIDHGMGVVIGETTEIGEHVLLFQGVTLGGTGKERGKRHPTIGNHVVVGTGAKVLGGITIGDHVKIGANAVVLTSVPPHSTVVGVPGRVVRQHGEKTAEAMMLDHVHMPDPLNETLTRMQRQIAALEQRLGVAHGQGRPEKQEKQEKQEKKERKPRGRGANLFAAGGRGIKPDEMPAETVQERQARMARMEKEERMKALALKKIRDLAAAQQPEEQQTEPRQTESRQPEPRQEGELPIPKKRPRRRRRIRKPGQHGPGTGAAGTGSTQGPAEPSNEAAGAPDQGGPGIGEGAAKALADFTNP